MDNNFVIITIGNTDYYIEASRLSDLAFLNGDLVNVSNSSITMVNNFDYQTTYPRITCASMSSCILRSNNTSTYLIVHQNYTLKSKYNMNILNNSHQNTILIALIVVLIAIKLMWKR